MRSSFCFFAGAVVWMFLPVQAVRADLMVEFSTPSVSVAPGSTVAVPVFFAQTTPNTEFNSGIQGAGFRLDYTAPLGTAAFVATPATTSIVPNPAWDFPLREVVNANASRLLLGLLVNSTPNLDGIGRILLGTFTFSAGSPGSVTTVSLSPFDSAPGFQVWQNGDGLFFDNAINYSATLTITTVPEPSTGLMLAAAATVALGCVRLRRQLLPGT